MNTDAVVNMIEAQRKAIIGKLAYFARSGVDVESCYQEVALKLIQKDPSKLDAVMLPKELYWLVRQACERWFRNWDDDPKRRVAYETHPEDDDEEGGGKQLPEVQAAEAEISERVWNAETSRIDTSLLLRRLPYELARTVELRLEGYTYPEIAALLKVSKWNVRSDFQDAMTVLKRLVKLERRGVRLAPREPVETPRFKAAREAIEWRCSQFRRKATKPTQCGARKLDPRSFWYSYLTIAFLDWEKELAARSKRGERFPYAKPRSSKLWPAAMMEWPLISIDHKLYDLAEFAKRTEEDVHEDRCTLPLAA